MDSVRRLVFFGASVEPSWLVEHLNEPPEVNKGEILAKVLLATLCPFDCQAIKENRLKTPVVLGHEAVCEVILDKRDKYRNTSITRLQPGTRITFSTSLPCNQCNLCKQPCYNKYCENMFNYGQTSITSDPSFSGCYSTHIILKPDTHVVTIPDSLTDFEAVTINCSLATAIHVVEVASNQGNETALVQGAGIAGLYICALLRQQGYKKVFCRDNDLTRLNLTTKFGAIPVQAEDNIGKEKNSCEFIGCQGGVEKVDCVIEICNDPQVISEGIAALKCGGTYLIVGLKYNSKPLNIAGIDIVQKSITIKGINSYEPRHLNQAVKFLSENKSIYPFESLISKRTYGLGEFDEAIQMENLKTYHRICVKPNSF